MQLHCFDCHPNVPNDYLPRAKKIAAIKRVNVVALSKTARTNFLFTRITFFLISSMIRFEKFHDAVWRFFSFFVCGEKWFTPFYLIIWNYFDFTLNRRHCRLSLKKIMQTNALFWTSFNKNFSSPWKLFFLLLFQLPCRAMVTGEYEWNALWILKWVACFIMIRGKFHVWDFSLWIFFRYNVNSNDLIEINIIKYLLYTQWNLSHWLY